MCNLYETIYPPNTAVIRFREDGVVEEWAIGAAETDNEETLREHLRRWRPEAEFVGWRMA